MKNRRHNEASLQHVSGTITSEAKGILNDDAARYANGNKSVMLEHYIVNRSKSSLKGLKLLG
jgi:hypothetical protein